MSTSLTGNALAMSLADLVQTYAANRQTCHVRVCTFEADGDLYLEQGELTSALYGDLSGDRAALALLVSVDATYEVKLGRRPRARNVTRPLTGLVLEAARHKDEGSVPHPTPRPRAVVAQAPATAGRSSSTRPFVLAIAGILGAGALALLGLDALMGGQEPKRPGAAAAHAPAPEIAPLPGVNGQADGSGLTGTADSPPRLVEGRAPQPPDASSALEPTIVCRVLVSEEGKVIGASVVRPRAELAAFETAALAAVRGYTFAPAMKAGNPVAVWTNWPVAFAKEQVARRIQIKGSDTIGGALGPDLASAFRASHPEVEIPVEALGSGTAFVGLFDGSADLGASSRLINDKELAEAQRLGIKVAEWVIGFDGINVIVGAQNPVARLTVDEAGRIFTGQIKSWKEVGGADQAIHIISRPSYSGTHGFFREKVLRHGNGTGPEDFAATTTFLEKNEDIVAKVGADPLAIAYVGAGWASGVKVLAIAADDKSAAIVPTTETIKNGTYPIFRPLLFYSRGTPRGDAAAFLAFVFSPMGQGIVSRHGFVPSDVGVPPELQSAAEAQPAPKAPAEQATRIVFTLGSHEPDAAGLAQVQELAKKLGEGNGRALVIGNADSEGSPERNTRVALARAQRVAALLGKYGVTQDRLQVESAGSDRPLSTNGSLSGRSQNRRVDVFLLPSGK